jgi:hypothetical protein
MTVEEALRTYLVAIPAITGLIGTRMYPIALPAAVTLPAVSYFKVSEPGDYTHQGASHLSEVRIQFSIWAATYVNAQLVLGHLLTALEGYAGTLSGVPIGHSLLANIRDVPEAEANIYHIAVDFMIGYET